MIPDRKKLLVDALLSGEYKQGRGKLKVGEAYCCLGVACDVYRREVGGHWEGEAFILPNGKFGRDYLPEDVADWFGFRGKFGDYVTLQCAGGSASTDPLPIWNDDNKKTFAEIARAIDQQL